MVKLFCVTQIFLICFIAFKSTEAIGSPEKNGDLLQILLPVSGFATTFIIDDKKGREQFYDSFLTTIGTTTLLKVAIDKPRPGNTGGHSFPSGHTSAAFQGAAFIHKRYGWEYGIPAYIAAGYVGWSRVEAQKHYWSDVAAGAAIGILSADYFTTPYRGLTITPEVGSDFLGIQINYQW